MNTSLYAYVMERLRGRVVAWPEVAQGSGVPYNTLKKIASGSTRNPGVKHVEALATFFQQRESSGASVPTPPAANAAKGAEQAAGVANA